LYTGRQLYEPEETYTIQLYKRGRFASTFCASFFLATRANELALDPRGRLKHPGENERALYEGERGPPGEGWEEARQ